MVMPLILAIGFCKGIVSICDFLYFAMGVSVCEMCFREAEAQDNDKEYPKQQRVLAPGS